MNKYNGLEKEKKSNHYKQQKKNPFRRKKEKIKGSG